MRLALVQPVHCDSLYKGDLGLAYLAAHLKSKGHALGIFDVNHIAGNLVNDVVSYQPDAVLVKVFGFDYKSPTEFITEAKSRHNVPYIIGGPTVTTRTQKAMTLTGADIGIAGDGIPTIDYALAGELNHPGIVYRGGNFGALERAQSDPEHWPTPDLSGFNLNKMVEFPLISSVGCNWAKCDFCFLTEVYRKIMFRSVPQVVADVRSLSESTGFDRAYFMDDNFLNRPPRLEEIVGGLREDSLSHIKIGFEATTAAVVKAQKYIANSRGNIVRIDIGAESFIQSQLDRWKTGSTPKENLDAFNVILSNGIHPSLYLIACDHETTKDEMQQMIDFYTENPALLFFIAGAGERRFYEDERDSYPDHMIGFANAFRFLSVASKKPEVIPSKLQVMSNGEIASYHTYALKKAAKKHFKGLNRALKAVEEEVITLNEANKMIVNSTLEFTCTFIDEVRRITT